ncbi:response regulator [Duganella sp. FT50W]|uniref:histidine kinase n=1 Tax=Duganella lactea TaxID=2692173 RepID=A0A6L8MPB8_9BURK|nr:hybrid sensor histidine kinase/response regulator [Duganella lactea]MYM84251.1 response regulator [Duganella lactea]
MRHWLPRFDAPAMLVAQMELIDQGFGKAILTAAMLAGGIILTTGAYGIIGWALAMTVVCGIGYYGRAYFPQRNGAVQARRYAGAMILLFFVLGVLWAIGGWWFIDPRYPATVLYFLVTIACSVAGGLVYCSPSLPVVTGYVLSRVLPLGVVLWRVGDVYLALATALFMTLILGVRKSYYQVSARSIQLRFQNDALIAQLRQQSDITDQARLEAERANRAKSVFLACASHDLRQPMHALGLFLVALGRTDLSAKQTELVGHVAASAGAAREMLNTLLDFSRVEAGVIVAQPVPVAIQALLRKLDSEFAPQARAKRLRYRTRDSDAVVLADPLLLEMVMRNLIANALRYTERGGVLVACRRRGDGVVLEVWDTGIGIPAAQHADIFREFHQLANPERDRQKGLGLGLAIVQGLLAAMGLRISLASRVARGSVFRVPLPGADLPAVATGVLSADPPGTGPSLAGLRLLVVDDDHLSRVVLNEILSGWGCHCRALSALDEVRSALQDFLPDLVITDFRLRDQRTGNDVLATIEDELGRVVPAIVLTGDTAPERLREARASGAILLHKPVDAEALRAALQGLAARPR